MSRRIGAALVGQLCEPVYPLSEGLTQNRIAALVQQALATAPELPEWIEPGLADKMQWPHWRDALTLAHRGEHPAARDRLAYDELLANSLALMLVKTPTARGSERPLAGDGSLRGKLSLPFALTGAQSRSIAEIEGDMAQPAPMLRLLQGDVGSGKTVVALEAMLIAVEAGAQAALLAPTEILARQHHETLSRMLSGTGVEIALFTGRDKGRARESILMGLVDGSIHMVVGTHAIFQDAVTYKNLALVVIDEQHRFGVGQRLMLTQKGKRTPHCLAMTATPIPRTLTLAQYGEMDVSRLDEMPPGRQPIDTRVVALERLDDVVGAVGRHLEGGQQAYWVCPMVRELETEDIAAAEARYAELKARFGDAVVLVHGQLRPEVKDAAMAPLRKWRGQLAGRDHGDRGWRRCAQRDADGDRTGRTVRPCPAAPVAWAGWAGRWQEHLPVAARTGVVRDGTRAAGLDARDAGRVSLSRRRPQIARRR
jgi:ATP-dependent DNA helicase RecG